ncbi:MAG: glucose-6-phosphate isomerase [Actinomycetota bacterium]|jgi:glucose-6-phosphate isomerase
MKNDKLQQQALRISQTSLRELFATNPNRFEDFSFQAADLFFDFSKHLIDTESFSALQEFGESKDISAGIKAMFAGEKINRTEGRAVLHTALRKPESQSLVVDGVDVVKEVHAVLKRMRSFATDVRAGKVKGANGKPIKHVVNIGIGGSDLGPVMAFEALKHYVTNELDFHYVSNVDGADISEVFKNIDPATSLFIVASKTFTTSETMSNARSAKAWLQQQLGENFYPENHFVALSTNQQLVSDFGISEDRTFGFWDWVGGRFSMESAIGLSTMIAIGPDNFDEMLAGFHKMDTYFETTNHEENVVVIMALLTVWYRNFMNAQTSAVLPYDNYLKRFPAYLQQLLMESNGKSVSINGEQLDYQTSPVYWGEPGTNGQHSFHQMLHQGTTLVPVDFIFGVKPLTEIGDHHTQLLANVLAQSSVLAFGKTAEEISAEGTPADLISHKVMPGNRPSTSIIYPKLTPSVLGQLVALYEHITLVQGLLWNVGSFDQWGVELGKKVANSIIPALESGETTCLDPSTAALIKQIRKS